MDKKNYHCNSGQQRRMGNIAIRYDNIPFEDPTSDCDNNVENYLMK